MMAAPTTPGVTAIGADAAPLLAALHATTFPPGEAWGADAIALMLALTGAVGLVATACGQPTGFGLARCVADEAELLTLAILPRAQRRGHARALLAGLTAACVARGATAMFIEVSDTNTPARALYEAAGARQVGRRRAYYADGTDALVLRLDLGAIG